MDNTYIELKVDSYNSIGFSSDIKKLELDEYWEELSHQNINIELYEVNDLDEHKNIAYLNGYFYDFNYIYDYGVDLFSTFDEINGDTSNIYNVLFENDEIKPEFETYCDNIFYIDRIYVKKAYRNKGHAKFILSELENILKYICKINVGIIIVCAQPFEKENNKEKMIRDNKGLTNKLINLYKKSGFKEVKTNNKEPYLIKICNP